MFCSFFKVCVKFNLQWRRCGFCCIINVSLDRTEMALCNYTHCEPTPLGTNAWTLHKTSLSESHKQTLKHHQPVCSRALWSPLWLMSLTYSTSAQPCELPNYPIITTALLAIAENTHKHTHADVKAFTQNNKNSKSLKTLLRKVQSTSRRLYCEQIQSRRLPLKTSRRAECVFAVIPQRVLPQWRESNFLSLWVVPSTLCLDYDPCPHCLLVGCL